MACSPRTARQRLDYFIDLAKQADQDDFQHSVRLGASDLTIRTGAAGEVAPIFTRNGRVIEKRLALQLIEVYSNESR